MNKKVSIIVPAYNEEGNIEGVYNKIRDILDSINYNYEIIFVNDGSIDLTEKLVLDVINKDSNVKLISFTRNFGQQAALIAGYNNCTGDAAITLDCDLQHPPELIRDLVDKWEIGFEIVNTTRIDKNQKKSFKRYTSKYFYRVFSCLAKVHLEEGSADFRLIDREVIEKINSLKEYDIFLRGMFGWFGFKTAYVEYTPNERHSGATKYNFTKMILLALNGITSFSVVPLRSVIIFGFCVSGLSLIYALYTLYSSLIVRDVISGWTSLILSVLFLGGVQLIAIGILGEYIGNVYMEVKERPRYIIKFKEGW